MGLPWFWSHDVEADQIGFLAVPGMYLARLSSYRGSIDAPRRFAALFLRGEPVTEWAVDVDAGAVAALASRAIAVTADVIAATQTTVFTVVLGAQERPRRLLTDLSAVDVTALLGEGSHVVDLATYANDGEQRFAVLVEPASTPSVFYPAVRPDEIKRLFTGVGVRPSRIRAYPTPFGPRVAITADRDGARRWFVLTDGSADQVSRRLEKQNGNPLDLDATGIDDRIRFTMVAAT